MENKQAFLAALQEAFKGLPREDMERSLEYYSEMIDDRMEEGMTEGEAVSAMEPPSEIAKQLLADTSFPKLVKARMKPSRALHAWEIILLILGSPVWAPLLLTAAVVLITLYLVFWIVIAALYAVDLSFAVGGLGGMIRGGILLCSGEGLQGLFLLGGGLACTGIAILLFFAFYKISRGLVFCSKGFVLGMKSWFVKKGDVR